MKNKYQYLMDDFDDCDSVESASAYKLLDPTIPLEALCEVAHRLTKKYHGNRLGLCSIYPVRVGRCGSDCKFCAQSAHHSCEVTTIEIHKVDKRELLKRVSDAEKLGIGWFSLVTSGESLSCNEFEEFLSLVSLVKERSTLNLCASIGELDETKAHRLYQAGVRRYHHNIETSASFFPAICTTHTFSEKLEAIEIAKKAGMQICCGGIISMGESFQDRIDMALSIRKLDVVSVPINILNPIPGTALANQNILSPEEIFRTFAVFRILLPRQTIRFAGGRQSALGSREYEGYYSGINALITGNFLTTQGKDPHEELSSLYERGFIVDQDL